MGAPLTSTEGLEVGDVLHVSVKLRSKHNGEEYWWRTFRCVTAVGSRVYATLLILKMNPDVDKDVREEAIVFTPERVFVKLEPEAWPQGVIAMRTKLVHQGLIDLTPF